MRKRSWATVYHAASWKSNILCCRYGKEKEAADRLKKLDEKTEKFTDSELMQLWSNLLGAAIQTNNLVQAKTLCKQISQKDPNNVQVRYILFEALLNDKNVPEMEESLKDIKRVAGPNAYWYYGQAALLYLQSQGRPDSKEMLKKALSFLAQAKEAQKLVAQSPLMEAAIYYMQGDPEMEMKCFMEVLNFGERNPSVIERTFQLLSQNQQFQEIDRWTSQFEKEKVAFSMEMNLFGAESAKRNGRLQPRL